MPAQHGYLYPLNRWPVVDVYLVAQHRNAGMAAGTSTDLTLGSNLPFVCIRSVPGGSGDGYVRTNAWDIECYAADEAGMWALADRSYALMMSLRFGSVIDDIPTHSPPAFRDYGDPSIWRAIGTYEIDTRPSSAQ